MKTLTITIDGELRIDVDPRGTIEVGGVKFATDLLVQVANPANVGHTFEITSNDGGVVGMKTHACPEPVEDSKTTSERAYEES